MLARSRRKQRQPVLNEFLVSEIEKLIRAHPTYRYRWIWALLRLRNSLKVNKKAVYRILKLKGWFLHGVLGDGAKARGNDDQAEGSSAQHG